MPAYNPADWANNYQRRAVAQQRKQQYMGDYYARTTREQEERENREARERGFDRRHASGDSDAAPALARSETLLGRIRCY